VPSSTPLHWATVSAFGSDSALRYRVGIILLAVAAEALYPNPLPLLKLIDLSVPVFSAFFFSSGFG